MAVWLYRLYALYSVTGEPGRCERAVYVWYTAYTADSHTGKYTAPPYLHLALGHRWPWDQVGGARVGRGTVALRYLGCLPTITSSISGVKDAQRSRRQSIWAVYTSLRHTAKYTGFGCILQVYSRLSSSRLACHAIQRIQRIQPYSHTRHTSYSAIQPPSVRHHPTARPDSTRNPTTRQPDSTDSTCKRVHVLTD